jgi:uncharacterized lipoprotein YajG
VKKILLLTSVVVLLSACHHTMSQSVGFYPKIYFRTIDAKSDNGVNVKVIDKRVDSSLIGKRGIFGGLIRSNQDLKQIFRNEISTALRKDGFKTGNDRVVNIEIIALNYDASWSLLSASSEVECVVSVMVKDGRGSTKYDNPHKVVLQNTHPGGYPLASTNENNINRVIAATIQQILENRNFLKSLI